jgi:hypothetical protein
MSYCVSVRVAVGNPNWHCSQTKRRWFTLALGAGSVAAGMFHLFTHDGQTCGAREIIRDRRRLTLVKKIDRVRDFKEHVSGRMDVNQIVG